VLGDEDEGRVWTLTPEPAERSHLHAAQRVRANAALDHADVQDGLFKAPLILTQVDRLCRPSQEHAL
jgi:hypothetical protein